MLPDIPLLLISVGLVNSMAINTNPILQMRKTETQRISNLSKANGRARISVWLEPTFLHSPSPCPDLSSSKPHLIIHSPQVTPCGSQKRWWYPPTPLLQMRKGTSWGKAWRLTEVHATLLNPCQMTATVHTGHDTSAALGTVAGCSAAQSSSHLPLSLHLLCQALPLPSYLLRTCTVSQDLTGQKLGVYSHYHHFFIHICVWWSSRFILLLLFFPLLRGLLISIPVYFFVYTSS